LQVPQADRFDYPHFMSHFYDFYVAFLRFLIAASTPHPNTLII